MRSLLRALGCLAVLWPASAWAQSISVTFLQTAEDETDLTTYTYAAQNLGTAAADRMITVVSTGRKSGASGCQGPTTVTVGGISATLIVTATNTDAACHSISIHKAAVPTGTTGSVVVTYGIAQLRSHVALYRSTGAQMLVESADGTSTANDPTGTLTIAANGIAIGGSVTLSGGATATWTGLTEQYDAAVVASTEMVTGAMLAPSTVQSGITVTANWTAGTESVGVWAAWAPITLASSYTHWVSPTGNTGGACTVGDPCTLTRAFALAGTTTMPAGSWVSVAAGFYNQAQITTTGGGVAGYPIRFTGAGANLASGSRLTGMRTSFPAAAWTLCPSMTYTYCADTTGLGYTVGVFSQRPPFGTGVVSAWVPILVQDSASSTGPTYTHNEPVVYGERFSAANVELMHCTWFHSTGTNTLYMHPCREAAPTDADQYYGGPDDWGSIIFTGSGDYLSMEDFTFEHINGRAILINNSGRGNTFDDIKMLAANIEAKGVETVVTDLFVSNVAAQNEVPAAGCYSTAYGGTGLASRSCWNYFGDGYSLIIGEDGNTSIAYNQLFDRITIERGWNAFQLAGANTINHLVSWGFANHNMNLSGGTTDAGPTLRNSVLVNSQDANVSVDEDWKAAVIEHNLFYGVVWFNCGRDGDISGATCPALPVGWTFRHNILANMISDVHVEATTDRDCNVWMPRNAGATFITVEHPGATPDTDYNSLAAIQAATTGDDNSIELPYGRWYDNSIFANWNWQHQYFDPTLTAAGPALLTTCGSVAGPDTLTTGDVVPPTARRLRFRVP